jgi:NAD(P)-dependent dehydrogenase (short-subunit alcohol dehydrogenase family)
VTDAASAHAAVTAAVERFGGVDVLVNNAGNFYAGFFEEITPEDFRAQIETNLFGPLNVTRAVLPVMRAQRAGLVITVSSTAGIAGQEFCTAYAASKFAVEGWMESLTPEVAPFGIRTMTVEPGFFRTELLNAGSTSYAQPSIEDYAERTKQTVTTWNAMNGQQGGDPAKLAATLIQLADQHEPPLRFVAGADAISAVQQKAKDLLAQADAHRELSSSLAHDDATTLTRQTPQAQRAPAPRTPRRHAGSRTSCGTACRSWTTLPSSASVHSAASPRSRSRTRTSTRRTSTSVPATWCRSFGPQTWSGSNGTGTSSLPRPVEVTTTANLRDVMDTILSSVTVRSGCTFERQGPGPRQAACARPLYSAAMNTRTSSRRSRSRRSRTSEPADASACCT